MRSLFTASLVVATALFAGTQAPSERTLTTRFTYKAIVPDLPPSTRALDLWVPIPSDSRWQTVKEIQVSSPYPSWITQEQKFGNRMVYVHADNPKAPVTVTVSFVVERKEVKVLANEVASKGHNFSEHCNCSDCNCSDCQADRTLQQLSLQPETLVPVGGRFLKIAMEVTQGKQTKLDKVRSIFEHVVAAMQYDYKRESPKLGEGDVTFVCDFRKGNCSDLHSYLISLARSLGFPAYLEYGFPITGIPLTNPLPKEGKISGYHCWTWIYDEKLGWFPVDASDARRWLDAGRSDMKEYLFGNLVLERSAVAFSRGRDIVLNPPQKGAPLNYFIYPLAEADGKSVKVNWELSYQLP
ncbi:MAG: transglutaminase-like domain-containing protein [Candidatus Fervidibacter sp.]|uniref:transglutaminase-like domain-containing protein n=1 Tax=Candidatus Fervidibacter sp. TaxID=3100871 RepID=UPI0040493D02